MMYGLVASHQMDADIQGMNVPFGYMPDNVDKVSSHLKLLALAFPDYDGVVQNTP